MIGYLFCWVLILSAALVALDQTITAFQFDCNHCGRTRFRQGHCTRCGVIGNPAPEPPKKNSRSTRVRFE